MNKTVNINLAGIFFHIDEDAYLKLQHYLEAIKRSFTDSQGRSEILTDIEARIAELFDERIKNEKQVVSVKEVDEVVTIMGQPEDYAIDEEIFEDEPQPKATRSQYQSKSSIRKLFRDDDNAYIGGVSAGLAHYFGIDPLWVRLIWVILFFGAGTGLLVYIILWCLIPAANSTADKLSMTGKPVNITNIEEKVKEGFSSVKESLDEAADKVKNADYSKLKSTSTSFFDALSDIFSVFFKIISKFIGVILIIVGASTLIALFISLFSVGTSSFFDPWWMDYVHAGNVSGGPLWLIALLTLLVVGIPFFFVFLLGLKILINNLKSIGRVTKFTLLGLWIASFLSLGVLSIKEFTEYISEATVVEQSLLNIDLNSPLNIKMIGNDYFQRNRSGSYYRSDDFKIIEDENGDKKIFSSDIRLIIRSTEDSLASISIEKDANGRSYQEARSIAGKTEYNYVLKNNDLLLNSYLLTDLKNKFKDQDITIIILLPEGTTFNLNRNTRNFISGYRSSRNIISFSDVNHIYQVTNDEVECLDCKEENKSSKTKKDEQKAIDKARAYRDSFKVIIDSIKKN